MSYQPLFSADLERLDAMTWEEAEAEQLLWEQVGRPGPSPIGRWAVWNNLLPECKGRWEKGDSRGLFDAIFYCGNDGIPLPPWCAGAIGTAVCAMDNYEIRSWQDHFNAPNKGLELKARIGEREMKPEVLRYVMNLRNSGLGYNPAIDQATEKYREDMIRAGIAKENGKGEPGRDTIEKWYKERLKYRPV